MGNEMVKSTRERDNFWRALSIFVALGACVASFYYADYALTAACIVLSLCLAALNAIWQRVEAIRFMMELRLVRDGTLT